MEQMNSNKLVEKYEPLINKLVNQYSKKSKYSWTEIKSMAYEGFALAISEYDEKRSNMDFTKYAAFSIRNAILTGLENEMNTVKFSYYARQKEETLSMIRMDVPMTNDEKTSVNETFCNLTYEISPEVVGIEYVINSIGKTYGERDMEIFCLYFGLRGKEMPGKDIAKKMNISPALVSKRVKSIIQDIRQNSELFEILKDYYGVR